MSERDQLSIDYAHSLQVLQGAVSPFWKEFSATVQSSPCDTQAPMLCG